MSLERLMAQGRLWRGRGGGAPAAVVPTGFAALDELLGGGWPRRGLTEILAPPGGGLGLVLPALARLSRRRRWVALVAPPHLPYAPALAAAGMDLSRFLLVHPRASGDALWAVEQALRSGTCGAVLVWLQGAADTALRRLQLAAEAGESWGILFRPPWAARHPSPAPLRLLLEPAPQGPCLRLLRRRGAWGRGEVRLPPAYGRLEEVLEA